MTDNEIIKGLTLCTEISTAAACEDCPYRGLCREDSYSLEKDALDLINRLKAENERLKQERDKEHDNCNHYMRMCAKAHIEGAKEFAERLLQRKYQSSDWSHGEHPFVVEENDILDVLEEMG